MSHKYECSVCNYRFLADDSYVSDPQIRDCPKCENAKGKILYHGSNAKMHYVISDCLGIQGVRNPADGKLYDSKSEYYKTVKAHGCEIVGNDPVPTRKRETVGDFDCKKALSDAIDQTGFMDKIKAKK